MSGAFGFPTTRWTQLSAVREGESAEKAAALSELANRYRRPLLAYVVMKVHDLDRAQDLVQEFFADSLAKDFFSRADRARGSFRAFLKTSVDRFLIDRHRREVVRSPRGGFVSPLPDQPLPEPVDPVTPETVYQASWTQNVIIRAVERYEAESEGEEHGDEVRIVRSYIIEPCLEGGPRPSLRVVAEELGLTRKEAESRLNRGLARLREFLLAEVNIYSLSDEETSEEIADMFTTLGAATSGWPPLSA
jgi:RNA polymerase sigma factor (sigma-70 family)